MINVVFTNARANIQQDSTPTNNESRDEFAKTEKHIKTNETERQKEIKIKKNN